MWIADYDAGEREMPTLIHVTNRTRSGMVHGSTYVPIEDWKELRNENANLRELIADVHESLKADKAGMFHNLTLSAMEDDMRELGIEVN